PSAHAAAYYLTRRSSDLKRGSITVKKLTDPAGDPATFDFSGDLTGTIGDGQQVGPQAVKPGSYSTTEDVPKGWDLTKIKCSDADSPDDTPPDSTTYSVAS